MSYIRKHINKQNLKLILIALMLIAVFVLQIISNALVSQLKPQNLVDRWNSDKRYAQLSMFFRHDYEIDVQMIPQYRASLYQALTDAAVEMDSTAGRELIDAYCTEQSINVSSQHGEASVRVFGVSKDFFIFHPITLLSGNYMNYMDDNSDGILLDEETAWTLFGARDVAGMYVDINGRACVVRGVVKSDEGLYSKASEEVKPTIYMDLDLLSELSGTGDEEGRSGIRISCYELLIQNPVKSFGADKLKEIVGLEEGCYELVENSSRFSVIQRLKRIRELGKRSMNLNGVTYPYWENRARAYEDVTTDILILQILCLIYPLYKLVKVVLLWVKNKEYLKICQSLKTLFINLYLDKIKSRKK